MSYKGRFITFFIVLLINLSYMAFYYIRDGHVSWFEFLGLPVMLLLAWYFGKQYDWSQYYLKQYLQKQMELEESYFELQQSRNELYSLFDNSNAFIWSLDLLKKELTVSKGIEKMTGFNKKEFKNNLYLWISRAFPEDKELVERYYSELRSGIPSHCQWRIYDHNGELMWIESYGNPILNSAGEKFKITGVAYDITERKKSEELIKHMAYHDQLTSLPNRYLLNEYLDKYLSLCKRNDNSLAVMFLDVDNFKIVNDQKGHDIGDILLKEVAGRLVNCIREGDVAARLGGDEFLILLKDVDGAQAADITQRLMMRFNEPFLINDEEYSISTSIGISMYPHDGQEGELLIQLADVAMYSAKKQGKNRYCFYEATQESESAV